MDDIASASIRGTAALFGGDPALDRQDEFDLAHIPLVRVVPPILQQALAEYGPQVRDGIQLTPEPPHVVRDFINAFATIDLYAQTAFGRPTSIFEERPPETAQLNGLIHNISTYTDYVDNKLPAKLETAIACTVPADLGDREQLVELLSYQTTNIVLSAGEPIFRELDKLMLELQEMTDLRSVYPRERLNSFEATRQERNLKRIARMLHIIAEAMVITNNDSSAWATYMNDSQRIIGPIAEMDGRIIAFAEDYDLKAA